jgi:chemotaxis protein histidine kinase CheA
VKASQEQSLESLFYEEAAGRIQSLLESFETFRATGEGKEAILRLLHTLKGSAGMVGFQDEAEKIHLLEERFVSASHTDPEGMKELERALKEMISELQADRVSAEDFAALSVRKAPFSLAQRLLASVSKFETLLDHWRSARQTGVATKDLRIKTEMAFGSELEELRKHSFRLAFGHPGDLFAGLEELVRVVAAAERKNVRLQCRSNANYLLREFIPEFRSALVHLLSNSVVHGLETPEQRKAAGKDPVGLIEVVVEAESNKLTLLVFDDGRGVDLEALEARYSSQAHPREWSQLSEQDRMNLLFEQGTTLSRDTSVHAGRGVGLSAVKETADRFGGEVVFEKRERGSCVRFTVPSPFFVMDCLLVECGSNRLACLAGSVERVEELGERELPSLCSVLNLVDDSPDPPRFVLWTDAQKKNGVSVEKCVGLRELVVYPLPELEGLPQAVVGLSDFGLGRQLAVDLSRLAKTGSKRPSSRPRKERSQDSRNVLVVDDSETTRSILVDVLRRAGFQVVEARDGEEALERLDEEKFKLVVSDLEMPNMDGLEFLEKMREASSPHASLPFLLFTSRDDTRSFQKAYLLGADRCLSKAAFQEADFLDLVEELL